jgi:putative lipoic acid-binding regulatory protein
VVDELIFSFLLSIKVIGKNLRQLEEQIFQIKQRQQLQEELLPEVKTNKKQASKYFGLRCFDFCFVVDSVAERHGLCGHCGTV